MQIVWLQSPQTKIYYNASTFRHLLDSLARPGKLNQLEYPEIPGGWLDEAPTHPTRENATLNPYALGAFLSLIDGEVSFAIASGGTWLQQESAAVRWLSLRSGASLKSPSAVAFAFFCEGRSGGLLKELSQGTLLEPESSATAFYCVEQLSDTPKTGRDWLELELSGPGILHSRRLYVAGMERSEIVAINASRGNYPLGIDLYLIDTLGQCVGLPRTTKILNR